MSDAVLSDRGDYVSGHGTHVVRFFLRERGQRLSGVQCGSAAGDAVSGTSASDQAYGQGHGGSAPKAKIVFQDAMKGQVLPPPFPHSLFCDSTPD